MILTLLTRTTPQGGKDTLVTKQSSVCVCVLGARRRINAAYPYPRQARTEAPHVSAPPRAQPRASSHLLVTRLALLFSLWGGAGGNGSPLQLQHTQHQKTAIAACARHVCTDLTVGLYSVHGVFKLWSHHNLNLRGGQHRAGRARSQGEHGPAVARRRLR